MEIGKVLAWDRKSTITLIQFITFLGISVLLPLFHQQWITGPMVNAMLFIAAVLVGLKNAMVLALLPSPIALSVGLLPAPLAPMIPFIMISNVVMVIAFDRWWQRDFLAGVIIGSVLKFLFLWSTSTVVVGLLTQKQLASAIVTMMSWPQLVTALIGGLIAYIFLKSVKKI